MHEISYCCGVQSFFRNWIISEYEIFRNCDCQKCKQEPNLSPEWFEKKSLTAKRVVLDGEIAAPDSEGGASFQLLQSYGKSKKTPLVVFDLLSLEGSDLRSKPLTERRKMLAKALR